jgi:hypothetical protein
MRYRINGHVYDTAKSKRIAHKDNGFPLMSSDCNYEAIYLTRTGYYFLYSVRGIERGLCAQSIEPLTNEKAWEWLDTNKDIAISSE